MSTPVANASAPSRTYVSKTTLTWPRKEPRGCSTGTSGSIIGESVSAATEWLCRLRMLEARYSKRFNGLQLSLHPPFPGPEVLAGVCAGA